MINLFQTSFQTKGGFSNIPEMTEEQRKTIQELIQDDPSLQKLGIGYYSNGTIVMEVYWSFDEKKTRYNIEINRNGIIES